MRNKIVAMKYLQILRAEGSRVRQPFLALEWAVEINGNKSETSNSNRRHSQLVLYVIALFSDIELEEVERNLVRRDTPIRLSWRGQNGGGAKA
jgi:hypothetical protein